MPAIAEATAINNASTSDPVAHRVQRISQATYRLGEVGVRGRRGLEAARALLERVELDVRAGLAQQGLRQLPREGPLADPLRPDEEQRVRESASA